MQDKVPTAIDKAGRFYWCWNAPDVPNKSQAPPSTGNRAARHWEMVPPPSGVMQLGRLWSWTQMAPGDTATHYATSNTTPLNHGGGSWKQKPRSTKSWSFCLWHSMIRRAKVQRRAMWRQQCPCEGTARNEKVKERAMLKACGGMWSGQVNRAYFPNIPEMLPQRIMPSIFFKE